MTPLAPRPRRPRRDPAIALINVVFLLLVFFMVAGTMLRLPTGPLDLVRTDAPGLTIPGDVVAILPDGQLAMTTAQPGTAAEALAQLRLQSPELTTVKLLPDRRLPAAQLITIAAAFQRAGAEDLVMLTQQALQ